MWPARKEHGHLTQRRAFFVQLVNPIHHKASPLLSSHGATSHASSPPLRSVQRFFVKRSAARDQSIRRLQTVSPFVGRADSAG